MVVYDEWSKVFALSVKLSKELRAKNPKLSLGESVKLAYKQPELIKAKKEYDELKEKGKTKKPAKKPAAKKPKKK